MAQPFRFMDLPTEVRFMVYERIPITTKTYGVDVRVRPFFQTVSKDPQAVQSQGGLILVDRTVPTSILRVSRQVHNEALDIMKAKLDEISNQPLRFLACAGKENNVDRVAQAVCMATGYKLCCDVSSNPLRRFTRKLVHHRASMYVEQLNLRVRRFVTIELACILASGDDIQEHMLDLIEDLSYESRADILWAVRVVHSLPEALTAREEEELDTLVDKLGNEAMFDIAQAKGLPRFAVPINGQAIEQDEWMDKWQEATYFREHKSALTAAQGHRDQLRLYEEEVEKKRWD